MKDDKEKIKEKGHKIGTFNSMMDVTKEVFRKRNIQTEKRELQKEDFIAAGITAVIIIALGLILWFIPATRGFIRSLIPF